MTPEDLVGRLVAEVPEFEIDPFLQGDDVRNLLAIELFEGFPWRPEVLAAMRPKTRHEHEIFVLCVSWDDTDVHAEAVIAIMRAGLAGDVVETQREAAFIAGRHLRGRPHPELLAELIRLVEDTGEEELVRELATSRDATGGSRR